MEKILERLKEITSYYSFGRILGYIAFKETIGIEKQLVHGQTSSIERLISNEIDFLVGMWMTNVVIDKSWPINQDDNIMSEVYVLMNDLHNAYGYATDLGSQFIETFFYEGDLGYDWQFADFAQKKYDNSFIKQILNEQYQFDSSLLLSTLGKIKRIITSQLKKRIEEKRKKNQYMSPINAFCIKPNVIKRNFSVGEQQIIGKLSYRLGSTLENYVTNITDRNPFKITPIIELPHNRGIFIVDVNALAIAMNETPYFWLLDRNDFGKRLGTIRGEIAENIVFDIIARRFKETYRHIDIRLTKSSNQITDIDAMFTYKDIGVVFQVKSKRLTELSHQGDLTSIERDCKKAVVEAFEQGKSCVACLKKASRYYTLKERFDYAERLRWYNICITLDAFPGITSLSYIIQTTQNGTENPVVAMSVYDLDIIFYLFQPKTLVDYIKFRMSCAQKGIYGVSEIYYIGAFMSNVLGEGIKTYKNRICREYALYADYIIKKAKSSLYKNKDVECDICELLYKIPVLESITCQ